MGGVEMLKNSEIEEGEAFQYKDDDDDNNIDPEIALSYIDEKIQSVLGHFQKDFEGGVSAENLGAKFGGYGSFLPTYERSPQRNSGWSHPKTPQTNSVAPRSPNHLPVEVASQNLKVSSNLLPFVKVGTASYGANALHKSGLVSGDVSVKQDYNVSSASVSRKSNTKDETSKKSGNFSDQRTLKVRIKVGPDNVARKNAAIYSGLGLDNSPSSSLGNSPEESEGMMPLSKQIADESPTSILQIMTSFPVPGGAIVSPLHDSLLCLIRNDKFPRDGKTAPPLKGSRDNFALLTDESVSSMGNGKLLKGKEMKFSRKSERAEHGNGVSENSTSFSAKKKVENDTPEDKDMLSNNLKSIPLLGMENGGETLKKRGRPAEVPREADQDGVRGGLFSSDMLTEDSLESRSGQDSDKSEKRNGRSGEKVSEHRALTCDDASGTLRGNGKSRNGKICAPPKVYTDTCKYKEDLKIGSQDLFKQKIGQQSSFHVQDEISMPYVKEKRSLEGKKSHGKESSKKAAGLLKKENSGIVISGEPKTTHGVSKSKDKVHKMKLQKDINKFRDDLRDPLDSKFKKNSPMGFLERPSSTRQKDSTFDDLETEHNASFYKSRERFSGKRVGDESMPRALIKDVPHACPSISGIVPASEVVPPVMGPILIEENWVCCDSCQKWRLLPYGTKPEQLPEKWLCSMLNWLPGMNRCDISEEETTKALNALYQLPLALGQNNLQSYGNGTASGVHIQHVDQNQQSLDYRAASSQGKKKRGLKEITKGSNSGLVQSSNSIKKHLQDSVKSRSLNDMNQSPAEANLTNKSSFHTLSKSHNLLAELKENHNAGGDTKQVKMKNKREADHYGYGIKKKTKSEDASHADKYHSYDMDLESMDLNSKSDLSTKASGKYLLKTNEHSTLGEMKCDTKERLLVSVKKLGDHAQISSDVGSFDMKASDKKNISMKKRKLKEWQDNQNGLDSNLNAESDSELKKEKKSRILKSGASSINNSNNKLDKTQVMASIFLSASQDQPIDGEAVRSINNDQKPRKHRRKFTSEQTLVGVDSLRRDLGPGQLSMTATSSSSKVSGSLKTRATLDDVKASPVESVSSSPLRTSFSEKHGSTRGNILGKDDATNGLPVIDEQRRCWDRKGDDQINQCGTAKKDKVSGGSHPEPVKFFPLDYQDGDANHKNGQAKSSDLLNGGAEVMENRGGAEVMENREFSSEPLATKNYHDEFRVDHKHHDNVLFPHKFGKGSSLQLKDNDRSSTSDFDTDEMKFSEPGNEHGDFSKKSIRYESEINPRSHVPLRKRMNNVKHSIPDKARDKSSKDEKVNDSSIGQCSKDSRMENSLKLQECDDSDAQLSALRSTEWNAASQENLIKDFDSQTKGRQIQKESRGGTPKLAVRTEWEAKHDSWSHQSTSGSLQEGAPVGLRVHASSNGDVSKASRHSGNSGTKNEAHQSLDHHLLDIRGARDFNTPSPGRTNSSSQTATIALKEAKELKDYADHLKASGFGFESNEINFQAALKFLHGASLLETCNEAGRGGEMSQMQVYSTTAKLCECCALEYERRHEMAAAALAYKCMEVAYWRVVYCKNSSLSRDRNELQACLQTFAQGESPSSSASDIDNLNNQATVDKAIISKSTVSHIAGNPVIVARNQSNFIRLLDFTRYVNLAVEASRKSQNAYSAANVALEEAQKRDCIVSVKKVIDFSFQDVEELMRLVQRAMEAITHAGLVGARD